MWFSKCEDSCVVWVLLGPHLVDDVSFLCNAGELLDFLKLPLEGSSVELDAGHGGSGFVSVCGRVFGAVFSRVMVCLGDYKLNPSNGPTGQLLEPSYLPTTVPLYSHSFAITHLFVFVCRPSKCIH